jgi:Uma2 family endonuclease
MGEARLHMTADEYLAFERAAEGKHELWDGEVFATSGASLDHNRIVRNLIRHLGNALAGSGYEVLPSDMRVRIPAHRRYVYPDVTIVCDPPQLEGEADVLLNPRMVIEVLAPSTAAFDRGDKFAGYRSIPSVREVILVSQDARRLESYTRQPDGSWVLREHTGDAAMPLEPLPTPLPLPLVYEGVVLASIEGRHGDGRET